MDYSKLPQNDKTQDALNTENQELKVLILKLNQDKIMQEKKVVRRNTEILRLKQLSHDKDDLIAKLSQQQFEASSQNTKDFDARLRLEYLENMILQNKSLVIEDVDSNFVEKILSKMIDLTNKIGNQSDTLLKQQIMVQGIKDEDNKNQNVSQNELKLKQSEINKLQEQMREENLYNQKRLNKQDDGFIRQRKNLEIQIQSQHNTNQILQSKLDFLSAKIQEYEKSAQEIDENATFNHQIKEQLIQQYIKLLDKYKISKRLNSKKSQDESSSDTNREKSPSEQLKSKR